MTKLEFPPKTNKSFLYSGSYVYGNELSVRLMFLFSFFELSSRKSSYFAKKLKKISPLAFIVEGDRPSAAEWNRRPNYTSCITHQVVSIRGASMLRGPRILRRLGRTHFLARLVLFHFSSFVYILTRVYISVISGMHSANWENVNKPSWVQIQFD